MSLWSIPPPTLTFLWYACKLWRHCCPAQQERVRASWKSEVRVQMSQLWKYGGIPGPGLPSARYSELHRCLVYRYDRKCVHWQYVTVYWEYVTVYWEYVTVYWQYVTVYWQYVTVYYTLLYTDSTLLYTDSMLQYTIHYCIYVTVYWQYVTVYYTLLYTDSTLLYTDSTLLYTDSTLLYTDSTLLYTDSMLLYTDSTLLYTDSTLSCILKLLEKEMTHSIVCKQSKTSVNLAWCVSTSTLRRGNVKTIQLTSFSLFKLWGSTIYQEKVRERGGEKKKFCLSKLNFKYENENKS